MAKELVRIDDAKLGECPFTRDPLRIQLKASRSAWGTSFFLLLFLGCLGIRMPLAHGQIVISEVLAKNQSFDRDNYGDSSDWLELYNPSAIPVNP